jgi:hypothetical protein
MLQDFLGREYAPKKERAMTSTTNTEKDKEAIVAIVKEMSESMTGAQSTKRWAKDALWFDTPPLGMSRRLLKFSGGSSDDYAT